jgi:SAM-dependent MidA family methyltransferase
MHFSRFMEIALYHPEFGYYRRPRDPFGREGDFYTAEQIQPTFGILMRQAVEELYEQMGAPAGFQVVELGAGRREMTDAFADFRYMPVDIDCGSLPGRMTGVVFANEFFDALPVDCFRCTDGAFHEQMVSMEGERRAWSVGDLPQDAQQEYLRQLAPPCEDGYQVEINLAALRWMERIAASLSSGYLFVIDYGYTRQELVRHPAGTLMSYRRHVADEDVLLTPGERDVTAHVPFTLLEETGTRGGMDRVRFERLAITLLRAGEKDQFASVLAADESEQSRRRLQLKTLLFGMGETFRTLVLKARAK